MPVIPVERQTGEWKHNHTYTYAHDKKSALKVTKDHIHEKVLIFERLSYIYSLKCFVLMSTGEGQLYYNCGTLVKGLSFLNVKCSDH